MYTTVRKINRWIASANKADVDSMLNSIILSERQKVIFNRFYLDKKDTCFIADSLNVSPVVINKELRVIREKIEKVI